MFEFWDQYCNIEQFSTFSGTFDEVQESTTKSSLIFFDSWWQDADIVWLHNPFTQLAENTDFQIACDRYNNAPESLLNEPNGGFVYTCANDRTIEFYKYWYAARERHPGKHDQDVLSIIIREQRFLDLGLKVRFLDTRFFSGFCQVQHYNTSYKSMYLIDQQTRLNVQYNLCYEWSSQLVYMVLVTAIYTNPLQIQTFRCNKKLVPDLSSDCKPCCAACRGATT